MDRERFSESHATAVKGGKQSAASFGHGDRMRTDSFGKDGHKKMTAGDRPEIIFAG